MDFFQKTILVVGCGISGISAATLLSKKKARVILYDENDTIDVKKVIEKLEDNDSIEIVLGELSK